MTPIRVITIAREYGSGGGRIGERLAERLGWKLLDRELITEVAHRAHSELSDVAKLDERPHSFISNLMKGFWRGNMETWSAPPPTGILDEDYLAELSTIVIGEAASLGPCVIVGRGSQCILREPHVFHVFVFGSTQEKLKRLQARHSTAQDPRQELEEIDHMRAAYIRTYHHRQWDDRHLYDLMINSDAGIDCAVSATLCAAGLSSARNIDG